MSDPTPERGGKARRCVKVDPRAVELLRETWKAMESMWRGVDLAPGTPR